MPLRWGFNSNCNKDRTTCKLLVAIFSTPIKDEWASLTKYNMPRA
jgi:hypothetical protein